MEGENVDKFTSYDMNSNTFILCRMEFSVKTGVCMSRKNQRQYL